MNPQDDWQNELDQLQRELAQATTTAQREKLIAELQEVRSEPPLRTLDKPGPTSSRTSKTNPKALRGKVGIIVMFVESSGTGNEDWTKAEVENEKEDLEMGLAGLALTAPPEMGLSFHVTYYDPSHAAMQVPYEPTNGVKRKKWVKDIMDSLGYSKGNEHDRVWDFERDVEDDNDLDHATVLFVVRDKMKPLADPEDVLKTAWPHAYFNGFSVSNLSSKADWKVHIHELLHTFHADDEYLGSSKSIWNGGTCAASSKTARDRMEDLGLDKEQSNANHQECSVFPKQQICVMGSGGVIGWSSQPFVHSQLCWHTRMQIGWGNTGTARVMLRGLPRDYHYNQYRQSSSEDFIDPPWLDMSGRRNISFEDKRYVVNGSTVRYASPRCLTTTTGGYYLLEHEKWKNCGEFVHQSMVVRGAPSDVSVGGKGKATVLEANYTSVARPESTFVKDLQLCTASGDCKSQRCTQAVQTRDTDNGSAGTGGDSNKYCAPVGSCVLVPDGKPATDVSDGHFVCDGKQRIQCQGITGEYIMERVEGYCGTTDPAYLGIGLHGEASGASFQATCSKATRMDGTELGSHVFHAANTPRSSGGCGSSPDVHYEYSGCHAGATIQFQCSGGPNASATGIQLFDHSPGASTTTAPCTSQPCTRTVTMGTHNLHATCTIEHNYSAPHLR